MLLIVQLCLAMAAFSANSILCRLALESAQMEPATFTLIRIASGALTLLLLTADRSLGALRQSSWLGGVTLSAYAALFSFAYVELETGAGALLLFGAVQLTMLVIGFIKGERLSALQWGGFGLACSGLVALFLPELTTPSVGGAALMLCSGVSWACYTLLGSSSSNPLQSTAGNFIRALPFAVLIATWFGIHLEVDGLGLLYAVASGALASALGYALWYIVVAKISVITASTVQLSVPILALFGGLLWLDEALTLWLLLCAALVLSGIALVIRKPGK